MAKRRSVHVVPHDDGWAVKSAGAERAYRVTDTKAEAKRIGRAVAKNRQAELVVHDKKGKIQNPDSFGNDPLPPRDRKR
jgi:hypothetical protein